MSRQIIVVEVTRTNSSFNKSQTIPLTIFFDQNDNYYLSIQQLERIKSKIIEVVKLGSNYRHPLLFDVQIVPGDGTDAIISSAARSPKRKRRTAHSKS